MPERSDGNQEGIQLSPTTTTRLIAEAAARQVVIEHLGLCPFTKDDVNKRLRSMEIRFGTLLGFMVGSGILGGVSGALLTKLLPQ